MPEGDVSPRESRDADVRALTEAFESFTETTQAMEGAYRRLEDRLEMMDRELAERNRELAFTRDYLNDILESMSDGVIAVDTDGVVTAFNRAAGDVLGVFDVIESCAGLSVTYDTTSVTVTITGPCALCPADLDGDGEVGIIDFLELLGAWGPCPDPCPPFCFGDSDGDCQVGITDFLLLLGNWGTCR